MISHTYSFIAFVLAVTVASAAATPPPVKVPKFIKSSSFGKNGKMTKIIRNIKKKITKCEPNVCFLLDGSGSINAANYKLQTEFVFTAAGLLDIVNSDSKYSALQYGGTPADVISEPTSDAQFFQSIVTKSKSKQFDRTSIVPSMLYCMSRFPGNGKKKHSPNKIVVMGDGKSTFGPLTGPFGPAMVSQMFRRRRNNDIVAVAVGRASIPKLAAISGSRSKVLSVDAWGVLGLQNLFEPLVNAICKN